VKHQYRPQLSGADDDFLTKLIESPVTLLIQITSPNGGEQWKAGSTQTIQWKTAGKLGNVRISYSTNEGTTWMTIIQSTRNTGTYSWLVPHKQSRRCLVKIRDASDGIPYDISDHVFSII